jgi:hypothetical protein
MDSDDGFFACLTIIIISLFFICIYKSSKNYEKKRKENIEMCETMTPTDKVTCLKMLLNK